MSKRLVYKEGTVHGRPRFLVHFIADESFDLTRYLDELGAPYVVQAKTARSPAVSVLVTIEGAQLRAFIDTVPRSVAVSYEEKEPEKC